MISAPVLFLIALFLSQHVLSGSRVCQLEGVWDDGNSDSIMARVIAAYEQGIYYFQHGDVEKALDCFYESIDKNATFIYGKPDLVDEVYNLISLWYLCGCRIS
jgi:hypothetical protein